MKFICKRNVVAAVVAMAFAGGVQAAIQSPRDGAPSGDLFFYAMNGSTNSVTFDLGASMAQLLPSNASKIVWDFDGNSVTATTPGSTSLSYGSVWSTPGFTFGVNTIWGVVGSDAVLGDLVSTSLSGAGAVGSTNNDQLTQATDAVEGVYVNALNNIGTHATDANGAAYATSGNALHFNGFFPAQNWRNNTPFSAGVAGEASGVPFYYVAYNLEGGGQDAGILTTFAGTFSFDADTAQLCYSTDAASCFQVAEIPEPSTYALFGAGLLMLGAIARRRLNG